MKSAITAIEAVAKQTDSVILFHSASGKDSIALLDLIHPYFKRVVCVYMYVVKDLSHINRYINYAKQKYKNAEFIQVPHFAVYSYIKYGHLGKECNPKQRLYTMAQLTEIVKERYGVEWSFFGFKKSDSMNRRLMLKTYDQEAINWETKKCYPLSAYKNKDVLAYITKQSLIQPEKYGVSQSAGTDICDINYLLFLREKFPHDLEKVVEEYPLVERILFEYDYERAKTE
ncbi:MAG: phosphoadenosine phosphosulfate reductase family protein [Rikenellaceae bacterium]